MFKFWVFSDFFAEGQIGLSLNIKCSSLHIVSRSKVSFPDEINSIEVRKVLCAELTSHIINK